MATKKWGKEDDAKLFALFRQPTNGLDPNQTDLKSCKAAHQRFFPEREYKNFAPLYRKKCSEFLLESELSGTRKRSAIHRFVRDGIHRFVRELFIP